MSDPNMEPRVEWEQEVRRKIQISFAGNSADQSVFSFYWNKLVKPSDEIILTHVLKNSMKEEEVSEAKEKVLNSASVVPFIEECQKRKIEFQSIFYK